jgi:energy-coupling factor transport system permease protein
MLIDYVDGHSQLHRLDVRTKSVWCVLCIGLAFLFQHPLAPLVLALFLLILFAAYRIPLAGVRHVLLMLLPILVIVLGVTSFSCVPEQFTSPGAQRVFFFLFPGNVAPLTVGGVLTGCAVACRILVMVLASLLLTATTPLEDFLQLSQRLRIPYVVAFIVTTAIRFVPTMETKSHMVLDAQRARGADLDTGGFLRRLRGSVAIMIPMIVDSIRMSEGLAMAMINRGFGGRVRSTFMADIVMRRRDYLLIAAAVCVAFLAVAAKSQHIDRL